MLMAVLPGCDAPGPAASAPATTGIVSLPALPAAPHARPSRVPPGHHATWAAGAAAVCLRFAAAAATAPTLGQARRAAARAHGTAGLQALYDGAGRGRDPQEEMWRARDAGVTPDAQLVPDADHDDHRHDAQQQLDGDRTGQREPARVDVHVAGIARAADGCGAALGPYRLSCLLLAAPVPGWLVENVDTETTLPLAGPDQGAPSPAGGV